MSHLHDQAEVLLDEGRSGVQKAPTSSADGGLLLRGGGAQGRFAVTLHRCGAEADEQHAPDQSPGDGLASKWPVGLSRYLLGEDPVQPVGEQGRSAGLVRRLGRAGDEAQGGQVAAVTGFQILPDGPKGGFGLEALSQPGLPGLAKRLQYRLLLFGLEQVEPAGFPHVEFQRVGRQIPRTCLDLHVTHPHEAG